MKGIVHQRSYKSIKRLSPKRRGYEMEKLMIRGKQIEKTVSLLFETNLLTYSLFIELQEIYQIITNEYYKIKEFGIRFLNTHSKTQNIVHTYLGIQFSKEFKKRYLGEDRKILYSSIENLIMEWVRDNNRTAGDLTRNILKEIELKQ